MTSYHHNTGPRLRAMRAYLGLSIAQAATMLRVTPRSLQAMETGRAPIPAGVLTDMDTLTTAMESIADTYLEQGTAVTHGMSPLELRAVGHALRTDPTLSVHD